MLSVTRRTAVLTTLLVLLPAVLTGCTNGGSDGQPPPTPEAKQPSAKPAPAQGLGDIIVAGRAITGAEPTGHPKVPYRRTYTDGELYAAVTGYRSAAFGTSGLEAVHEDVLGPAARHRGRPPGTVVTSIDPATQRAAAEGLRGETGAAVALDVLSGRIRALVSAPSVDPATFGGSTPKDAEAWKKAQADDDKPLLNRALREAVTPGGVFQPVVAAAAVEHGLYASVDAPTRSPLAAGDPAPCENATLRTALRLSCANVFARVAADLGADTLAATAETFGFNDDALAVPVRAAQSTFPRGDRSQKQLAAVANGLGDVTATPLQAARIMAVLAAGGKQLHPSLVDHVTGGDGASRAPTVPPGTPRRVLRQDTAEQLRSALGPSETRSTWVAAPQGAHGGTGTAWTVSLARTADGRPVAIAVCVTGVDGTAPAMRVAELMGEAARGTTGS
ncbi:penicillin-binding transpeptidase domain-containing protein [Streptomyces ficellus]|nr:penicillin-binding transpeptidase domain-containing protein [Streptomyces ficellus]